jgi:predicted Zn-ribbon and HTH transcriptional regulator
MKCKDCKHLVTGEDISRMSRIMGYTAECSLCGILFKIEKADMQPSWCPLREKSGIYEKI